MVRKLLKIVGRHDILKRKVQSKTIRKYSVAKGGPLRTSQFWGTVRLISEKKEKTLVEMPRKYFFVVTPNNIYYEGGDPLPDIGSVLNFVEDMEHAHAQLFRRGFNVPFEDDIFTDDGVRFKHKEYQTGQNGLSNLLGALTDNVNPYAQMRLFGGLNIDNMRFDKLTIHRYIQPEMKFSMEGGKHKRKVTRRTKKVRKSRRA